MPLLSTALLRALLPIAERDEVLGDLQAEYEQRQSAVGRYAARRWIWRQVLGSVPSLVRRGWWRGMTGFEPDANRMRPGGPMFETWIMDGRYAVRRLIGRPTYALLAVLTLALGAGGTAAIFSVVRALLLEPLPIAQEERVAVFWFPYSWSEREYLLLRPNGFPGFQRVAAYRPNDVTLEIPGGAMRLVPGIAGSADLFDVLGTAPLLGRTFRPGEDAAGAELVVVLSHSLWQELGSDPSIVGKPLQLGGFSRTVVGVMPPGFWFPSPTTGIWTAAQMNPQNGSGRYTLVGRVAEGFSIEHMDGPLQAIASSLDANFDYPPQWDLTRSPSVTRAREYFVGDIRPSLMATLAAMGVILLIACGNVAALMLGQIDARATELAVRTALGANRQRLLQQLVIESLILGLLAGVSGAALAVAGFQVLLEALPLGALAETAHLDWTVFWAAMLAALGAAVLVALVPGLALWRGSSVQSTLATTRTGGIGTRGGGLEGTLVVAQIALAVLLTAGAGLLIRSVANLRAIHPGVETRGIVVVDATMPLRLNGQERRQVIASVLPSLQALPGVKSVGAAQKLPLRGTGDNWGINIPGRTDLEQATTAFRMVTREYFTTVGMPIVRGRNFTTGDREDTERVVIINEATAARFFPNEDPIGRTLQTFDGAPERIVGIVGNAAEAALTDDPVPARYMLYEHVPPVWHQVSFVLRTDSEERTASLIEAARSVIAREGTLLAVQQTTTVANLFDLAVGPAGRMVTLLALLAGLALLLGAVGVYGVISHYVGRRSKEYGIRIALGQQPAGVVQQVVGRGVLLVAIGSVIGVAAALTLTRLLSSLLYGVTASDPLALAAAVAVLLLVGVLAAFVPARRASLTDPAVVLRQS
jgi:putative ABC transport system permease protein